MKYVAPIITLVLLVCSSCGHTPVPVKAVEANDAIAGARVHVEQASTDVKRALPHTSKLGEPYLLDAGENLVGAASKLTDARKSLTELQEAHGKLLVLKGQKDTIIASYQKRWVGDRTFYWLRVILVVSTLAVVGAGVLYVYTGGWLQTTAGWALHFVPFPVVPMLDKLRLLLGR